MPEDFSGWINNQLELEAESINSSEGGDHLYIMIPPSLECILGSEEEGDKEILVSHIQIGNVENDAAIQGNRVR